MESQAGPQTLRGFFIVPAAIGERKQRSNSAVTHFDLELDRMPNYVINWLHEALKQGPSEGRKPAGSRNRSYLYGRASAQSTVSVFGRYWTQRRPQRRQSAGGEAHFRATQKDCSQSCKGPLEIAQGLIPPPLHASACHNGGHVRPVDFQAEVYPQGHSRQQEPKIRWRRTERNKYRLRDSVFRYERKRFALTATR
jgi:hypothetical protein